jgi:DNA invertase Pin-like site-specific DNA recombinase
MNYIKNCPNCERIQTYTTKSRLQKSIQENWVCNLCSSAHTKKTYNDDIVDYVVKLYEDGNSFSKISTIVKIKRDNVRKILIDKNVWVENRDKIKKDFTSDEIKNILKKYEEGLSIQKISDLYGFGKSPIKRVLKNEKLLRKGYSDGKKINLSEYQIKKIKNLYLNEFKNSSEIADQLGLNKSFVGKHLDNCDYRRNRSEGVSVGLVIRYRGIKYNDYLKMVDDLNKYKSEVMKITRQQPICELLNYDKRGVSGVDGAYHLDHKFSISEGFKNGILPKIIGNIKNLEFIPWKENVKKRTKCSITIKELIN